MSMSLNNPSLAPDQGTLARTDQPANLTSLDLSTRQEVTLGRDEQARLAQALHIRPDQLDQNMMRFVVADNKDQLILDIAQRNSMPLGPNGEVLAAGFTAEVNGRTGAYVLPQNTAAGAQRHGLDPDAVTRFIGVHEVAGLVVDERYPNANREQLELAQQVAGNRATADWKLAHAMDMVTTMRYFRDPAASPEYKLVAETMKESFDKALATAGVKPTNDTFTDWVKQYNTALQSGSNNADAMKSAYESVGVPANKVSDTIRNANNGFVAAAQKIVNGLSQE
jgi:hypothetical protein